MTSKQIDQNIDKIYDLTNIIKALDKRIDSSPDNVELKTAIVKVLLDYEELREDTVKLIDEYFKSTKEGNVYNLNYLHLQRKLRA